MAHHKALVLRTQLRATPEEVFEERNLVPGSIVSVGAACLYMGVKALNQFVK